MSALTPSQVQRLDVGVQSWEDNGGPILNHLVPVVAALIAEAVDQARAEERERIAEKCCDGFYAACGAEEAIRAARIARSQP